MANQGSFCVLFHKGEDAARFHEQFGKWVDQHPLLKNLEFLPRYDEMEKDPYLGPLQTPHKRTGPSVMVGICDRICAKDLGTFLRTAGLHKICLAAYVVDSTYGEEWEEAT